MQTQKKEQEKEQHEPQHKKCKADKMANIINLSNEDISLLSIAVAEVVKTNLRV